jgi:hypothetical protein
VFTPVVYEAGEIAVVVEARFVSDLFEADAEVVTINGKPESAPLIVTVNGVPAVNVTPGPVTVGAVADDSKIVIEERLVDAPVVSVTEADKMYVSATPDVDA